MRPVTTRTAPSLLPATSIWMLRIEMSSSVILRCSRSCRNHEPKESIRDVFIVEPKYEAFSAMIGLGWNGQGSPKTGPSTQLIPDPSPALLPVLHQLVSSRHFD
jgi:hypothetical protein